MPQLMPSASAAMPAAPAPLRLKDWPSAGQLSAEGLPEFLLPGLRPPVVRRAWLDADQAAAQAREFTRHVMQSWGLAVLAEDATLVVSELVTNALRHGVAGTAEGLPAGVELMWCRRAGLTACVVIDPGPDLPLLMPPDHAAETGRGLHVVEALSAAWGWARLSGPGKAVWATLRAPGPDRAPAPQELPLLRQPGRAAWPATRGSGIVRRCGQPQPDRHQRPPSPVPHRVARPARCHVRAANARARA